MIFKFLIISFVTMTLVNSYSLFDIFSGCDYGNSALICGRKLSIVRDYAEHQHGELIAKRVTLKGTHLRKIPTDFFRMIRNVEKFVIDGSDLEKLDKSSFNGATNLKIIVLQRNPLLTTLGNGVFENVPNIQALGLIQNRNLKLNGNAFVGLGQLDYLEIDGVYSSSFVMELFEPLTSLKELLIRNVPITILSNQLFVNKLNLEVLTWSYSNITQIDEAALSGLNAIKGLDFSNNNLTKFPIKPIDDLPLLTYLNLENNQLKSFDFKNLKRSNRSTLYINLSGNKYLTGKKVIV